ncbi:putative coiled-coil protein SlyX [Paraburkholderia sp. WSM4174]
MRATASRGKPAQRTRQIVRPFEAAQRGLDRLIGGDEERMLAVVKDVDQPDEALQRMRLPQRFRMQTIDDQALPSLGEIEVVEVRAACDTQLLEVRPQQYAAGCPRFERPARRAQPDRLDRSVAFMAREDIAQRGLARLIERREKAQHLGRFAAEAVIAHAVEMDHREAAFDLCDGRQKALVKLGVAQQIVRCVVRRQHDARAQLDRGVEKAAHQERVGDIVHMEFVEAQQLDTVEPLPRHVAEPVVATRRVHEPAVHLAQELVEMQAPFAAWCKLEQRIDDEALTAARQSVTVDALRPERGGGPCLPRTLLPADQRDERADGLALPRIGRDAARGQCARDAGFVKHGQEGPCLMTRMMRLARMTQCGPPRKRRGRV